MNQRKTTNGLDFESLRLGLERCDLDLILGFYAEDAELSIVNAQAQRSSPFELRGRAEIAKHLRTVFGQETSHSVEREDFVGEDRVTFRETCEYPDGGRLWVETTLEVHDGKIVRQADVVVKDAQSVMRSPLGFLGATVLLLALPIAVLTQVLFGSGSGTTIHVALGVGCALVALSVFDFETPRWVAWIGCVAAGSFAGIVLVQAASELIQNDSFTYFALQVLGNWPEKLLTTLLIFWLSSVVLITSQGNTRILGFVAMAIVVCVEAHNYILLYRGEASGLKALYLLPFVWLHFESRKKPSHEVTTTREQPKTTYPRTPTGTPTFGWMSFQPALSRPSLMLSGQ